ncbi:MAG: DUF2269 family protein [Actinomycetota bacterium]
MGRGDWIRLVLVLHVLGAIAGLGTNLTYGLIMTIGDRAGGTQRVFSIQMIQKLDRRLANPAYMAQLATGLLLVWLLKLDLFGTSWLLLGIALYVIVAVLGISVFAPISRRRGALAERLAAGDETVAEEYGAVARRANRLGVFVTAIVVVIVALMVAQPQLW